LYRDNQDSLIQTQKVNVQAGRLIPDSTGLSVINASCFVVITQKPTAKYNCNDSIVNGVALDPVKYDNPGVYYLRWRFIYNRDTLIRIQQVNVRAGKITPDIDSLPAINGNCSVAITKIPTATTCRGSVITAIPLNTLKYDQPGQYTIRWLYRDNQDSLIQTQKVNVQPGSLIPDSASLSVINASCSVIITSKPTAKYSCNDSIVAAVPLDSLRYDIPGVYNLRWRFIYNRDTLIRIQRVNVTAGKLVADIDSLPVITGYCSVVITNHPTATNCSGVVTTAISLDPLQYDKPGWYQVRWRYFDKYDTLTQIQLVNVKDNGNLVPDADTLVTITGDCSAAITKIPTATNTCTGEVIVASTTDPLIYENSGQYTIQWKFNSSLNSLTQTQVIIVKGRARIVPRSATLPVLEDFCSVTVTDPPTAVNRCTGKVINASTTDPLKYTAFGEHNIVWTYIDGRDTLTQTQKVIVKNYLTPLEASLPDIQGECEVRLYQIPIAVNSCKKIIKAVTTDPLIYSAPGTYNITWTYKDGDKEVIQTQKVTVLKRELSVKVYPNPTPREFMIYAKTCQRHEKLDLRIYDMVGRLIEVRQVNVNQEVRFGSAYPASAYFAHVIWNQKRYVFKLIKSR
jgi:hypothetical protein